MPRTAPELAEPAAKQRPVAALQAVRERLSILRRAGIRAATAADLAKEPIPADALAKLVQGVSANYARADWLDVSRQLSDPVREASRDALTAFLLQREGLQTAEQLFDRFYIDVGTNSFVLTSRIRQAIFAVQIFIQRCLMGFEIKHGVTPGQIDAEEWKTISRQAVWAARGKALLYPEELLNPAWRDNKSPAFKAFESALQQGDITPANAEVAYRSYLDSFTAVASLEVCGTFLQEVFEGREAQFFRSVLHVVGRTRGGAARKYFYRRLNRYQHHEEWTAWEPVEVGIDAVDPDRQEAKSDKSPPLREAGVHLLPVVWRGQVYLFWPVFTRKVDQEGTPPVVKEGTIARFSMPYWEIKLCWTRKDGAGWTPREQSAALFETWWYESDEQPDEWDTDELPSYGGYAGTAVPTYPDPSTIALKAAKQGDALRIIVSTREGAWGPKPRGAFAFSKAAAEMRFTSGGGGPYGDHFRTTGTSGAWPSFMGVRAKGTVGFVATAKKPEGDVFFSASNGARITTLNQFYAAPFTAPLFIDVEDRSYFAQSSAGVSLIVETIEKPKSKPSWYYDAITKIQHQVIALDPKVTEVKNPWMASAITESKPYMSVMTESAPVFGVGGAQANPDVIAGSHSDGGFIKKKPGAGFDMYVEPSFRFAGVPGLNLDVKPFHHPFADHFAEVLRRDGLPALLTPETQRSPVPAEQTFAGLTKPVAARVKAPAAEGVDFDQSSPYGQYNWEIFFHAPMMLAQKLSDNAQQEAAIDLVHRAAYTPFSADPEDCWRFEGLRGVAPMRLDDMLALLSRPDSDPEKQDVIAQIETTRLYPFQAHRIARLRPLAYKKWVVAFDVRLHLALGDRFFRRFTPEDVNQAIQYYIIAYREMGRRPEIVTQRATMPALSYAELRPDLDATGNVMFTAESKLAPAGTGSPGAGGTATGIMQRGSIGYFGIPKNEKLLALWDDVGDRLFKIRNGMNIEGAQMQLPLFSPPIDPALLAEAIAAGLDIASVLDQLAQPLPKYRYAVMFRRAVEHAEAAIRLGELLQSARERRDAEDLARTHARHAREMAGLVKETRDRQLEEAKSNLDLVTHEEDLGKLRWMHYAELLDAMPEMALSFEPYQALPARKLSLVDADKIAFETLRVIPDIAMIGGFLLGGPAGFAMAAADERGAGIRQLGAGKVLQEEKQELESSFESVKTTFEAAMLDTLASLLGIIPNFEAAVKPLGAGAAVHLGGQFFAAAASAKARNKRAAADMQSFVASVYRKQAEFVLRERSWVLEMNDAALEVQQARRRKAVAAIRVDLAEKAVKMQERDIGQADEIEAFLKDKVTAFALYDWQEKRLRKLFTDCLALAHESAAMAEACYSFERERPAMPFIRLSMPTSASDEFLAGHELLARLRDMDRAYMAAPRLSEFTRSISLRQIDPYALNELRETSETTFLIPEVLFDIDHAGYYDRRMMGMQVTIPCVAGPYAPVTGTLTLVGSERRKSPKLAVAPEPDPQTGASIALSSGRNDSGLIELSYQDPQYRPFEGFGAVSMWHLSVPKAVKNIDNWVIADVILTIPYTAKRGSTAFRNEVTAGLKAALGSWTTAAGKQGVYRLVSLRHDLPDIWHDFKAGNGLSVALSPDILSFMLNELGPDLAEVVGKVRVVGGGFEPLKFNPPQRDGSQWTVEPDTPPPSLATPKDIEDITLFARFDLH